MFSQRSSYCSCQARERLLQVGQELRLQVNCRESSLIPSQDMTYFDMQIQSVRFMANPTATWVGNLLKIMEEFSFFPGPPSCSLASSSGPPFVSYSSGKGWDVMDTMLPDSPQVLVGLPRRVPSYPLGSSVSGGPSLVVLGDSTTTGRRSFSPSARLELLLGRVRRRLGRHRRGTPNVSSFVSKPKGILHQPQGDDGVQGSLFKFSSLLRGRTIALFCDFVTTFAYLRRSGGTRSQDLFLEVREILLWVESMKITLLPQLILGSLNSRADLLSRPNLVMGSVWTLHQEVVQDLLRQWPGIIVLFATSLSARLPVFFATAWHSSSLGTTSEHMPSHPLPS